MTKDVKPAVKALIERNEKILVLKAETENNNYWVLPGGKVEYGEEPEKSLERELEEEISCEAKIGDPIGMYHFFMEEADNGDQVVLTVFEADIRDQKIDITDNPAEENITEYRWMDPEELIRKTNNSSLAKLVEEYFSGLPKLVRDDIPEIIKSNNEKPVTRKLSDSDVSEWVLEKVVEEAEELKNNPSEEEIADLLEVIDRFRNLNDITGDKIEQARRSKVAKRGKFEKNIILEEIEPKDT